MNAIIYSNVTSDTQLKRNSTRLVAGFLLPKFRGPMIDTAGELALWRAVITQALMDSGSASQKREALFHKYTALCWLKGDSKDFRQVCHLAGRDPSDVKEKSSSAIARGCNWRNKGKRSTLGKDYTINKSEVSQKSPEVFRSKKILETV